MTHSITYSTEACSHSTQRKYYVVLVRQVRQKPRPKPHFNGSSRVRLRVTGTGSLSGRAATVTVLLPLASSSISSLSLRLPLVVPPQVHWQPECLRVVVRLGLGVAVWCMTT